MGFIKKIWKDRISEFPTRRSLTKTDGSSELVTVARSEGMISEEGDAFSAENMNDFENRVANGFSELNENFGGLSFGVDGDGNYGYYGADGSLIPFKSVQKFEVNSGWKSVNQIYFDLKSHIHDYKNYTISNFLVQLALLSRPDDKADINISYTYADGIIYVTSDVGRIFYTQRAYPATIWFSPN